jgi:hypothetical protein
MNSLSCRLTVESLEDRAVPSTVVETNFNNDDYMDKAELTSPTTITVSLGSADGYIASATLTAPKNLPIGGFSVDDYDGDGELDIRSGGIANSRFYVHTWLGNGDGTFDDRDTQRSGRIRDGW